MAPAGSIRAPLGTCCSFLTLLQLDFQKLGNAVLPVTFLIVKNNNVKQDKNILNTFWIKSTLKEIHTWKYKEKQS